MSDQPGSESDAHAATEPEASWSANGTHDPDDEARPDAPAAGVDEAAPDADTAGGEAVVADSDGAAVADSDEAAIRGEDDGEQAAAAADEPVTFLDELVRAMRTTAGAERARIAADIDRRREEHLASIQARRETESQEMRELADSDLKAIDDWAQAERQRIDEERERRATVLAEDLKVSLAEHGAGIDREIERAEAAIASYRTEVDAFFAAIEGETDPVAIARHAALQPSFPDLTQATAAEGEADGGAGAASEETARDDAAPTPVGVMDPDSDARRAATFAAWNAASAAAAEAEAAAEAGMTGAATSADATEVPAPVALGRGAHDNGPGTILHAVPSGRPLSWLRRDRDGSDDRSG